MSEYYGYGSTPRIPIPWKDREGFKRYFREAMGKCDHLTTQQVIEYDMSVRQAAHAAYLAEREADPSLPIRYNTLNGLDDDPDTDADLCLFHGDPEEIIPVITEESSSPNSIEYSSTEETVLWKTKKNPSPYASTDASTDASTEGTVLWKTKKNPSPHASTDASTEEVEDEDEDEDEEFKRYFIEHYISKKKEADPSLPCRYSTINGLGDNDDDDVHVDEDYGADFCLSPGVAEVIIPVFTEGSSSPQFTGKYSSIEGVEALLGKTKKNPSPHASTDASTEEDEAATFGEGKTNLHFLPRDSPPDFASVTEIPKFKRMSNKRRRMMNKSRNFPYRSFYLLKRKASTAGKAS